MKDFLGNELAIGDIILRVGAESGCFAWSKITGLKAEEEYGRPVEKVGVVTAYEYWNDTVKTTSRVGWTFPCRCIKLDSPQHIKEAFDAIV